MPDVIKYAVFFLKAPLTLFDGGELITEALVTAAAAGGGIAEDLLRRLITDSLSEFALTHEQAHKAGLSKTCSMCIGDWNLSVLRDILLEISLDLKLSFLAKSPALAGLGSISSSRSCDI